MLTLGGGEARILGTSYSMADGEQDLLYPERAEINPSVSCGAWPALSGLMGEKRLNLQKADRHFKFWGNG